MEWEGRVWDGGWVGLGVGERGMGLNGSSVGGEVKCTVEVC